MINLSNITKAYNGTLVLDSISLTIGKADKLCFMGRSGAGKTTLLRIIAGLEAPDSGLVQMTQAIKMSIVFQENRLVESLTAEKNILLCTALKNITEYAQQIGLTPTDLKKPIALLSGGQKRRVAILRAVLAKSDILIFDELLQGMDKQTSEQVLKFVNNNLNGRALIAVTHSAAEAEGFGARIISLKKKGQ